MPHSTPKTLRRFSATVCALALTILSLSGCSTSVPRKEPGAQAFPAVHGTSLEGKPIALPQDLQGAPAILLIGYVQEAQFDIDRWILGLKQLGCSVRLLEVPTIAGMMPGLASNFIDSGMRRGIPKEDWPSVVTIYNDAEKILSLTGNENPRNTRVFLLDKQGTIRWFFDRGYSADQVITLHDRAKELL